MKVAVIAGTPVDTKMGSAVLKRNNIFDVIEIAISKNPTEQTIFQTSSLEYKEQVLIGYITVLKAQNCNVLFVYCNSLSAAVDFEKISREHAVEVITPLQIYKELATKFTNIAVLSANAQGLAGIEKVMFESNSAINIVGITLLDMVKDIEAGIAAQKIAEKFAFDSLATYINNLDLEKVILGCTHFPYIEEELAKRVNVEVINPTAAMIAKLI